MVAVFTVLIVIMVSLVIIRVAAVGLALTGLSKDHAQFQALSAFTGSGFTTSESEAIVKHPVRRRIVMHLMLVGNAGIVIAVTSLLLSFLNVNASNDWTSSRTFRLGVLAGGVVFLWIIANSRHVESVMWQLHSWVLRRWTEIEVHDYTSLLRLVHDYAVSELRVKDGDWLAGHSLKELQLASEGLLVLGIEKADDSYEGAPRGDTVVEAGDLLIIYGRQDALLELDHRQVGIEGNLSHVIAVTREFEQREQAESPRATPP